MASPSSDDGHPSADMSLLFLGILGIFLFAGLSMSHNAPATKTNPALEKETNVYAAAEASIAARDAAPSPYQKKVRIRYVNALYSNTIYEYMVLEASAGNSDPINITGWQLQSTSTGAGAIIGSGVTTPGLTATDYEEPILLAPGDEAYVMTGPSPEGYSFKQNKCTGYFSQFHQFYPPLGSSCPRPAAPVSSVASTNGTTQTCQDFVRSIPSCTMPNAALSQKIDSSCQEFISTHLNYESCVQDFKHDADFYSSRWLVYLNVRNPMWVSSHETIALYDAEKRLVDLYRY